MNTPPWNVADRSGSIRRWVEELHKESVEVFLRDKTHAHIIFLFKDEGLVSVLPVPAGTNHSRINGAIVNAIKEYSLYAVIYVGEAWAYFPKEKDHTVFQLMDGEMKVSDLRLEDRSEILYLKMESRDGDSMAYLNRIARNGEEVELGEDRAIEDSKQKWFGTGGLW